MNNSAVYDHKATYRASCKVPVILVRF